MTDYIKAAVELADGWTVKATEFQEWYTAPEPCGDWFADGSPRAAIMLDAIAAQLVRQVDATDYGFESHPDGTALIHDGEVTLLAVDDSDRTMNAIKAIVDSKVLK